MTNIVILVKKLNIVSLLNLQELLRRPFLSGTPVPFYSHSSKLHSGNPVKLCTLEGVVATFLVNIF